jgi:hypothetical protein
LLQPCRIFLSQISSSLHLNFFSFHYLDNEDNGMEYIQEVRKKLFKTFGKSRVKKVRGSQLSVPISFYPRHPPLQIIDRNTARGDSALSFTYLVGVISQPIDNSTLLLTLGWRAGASTSSRDEGFTCDGVHHGAQQLKVSSAMCYDNFVLVGGSWVNVVLWLETTVLLNLLPHWYYSS